MSIEEIRKLSLPTTAPRMEIVLHRDGKAIPIVRGSDVERLEEMVTWLRQTPTEPGDKFELRQRKR